MKYLCSTVLGEDIIRLNLQGVDKENSFIKMILLKHSLFEEVKFIYSEKAKKFFKISTNYLTGRKGQIIGGDFAKFCGLLRIYDRYCKNRDLLKIVH